VSQLARRYVTVALTGDGGDELFAGYQRYFAILSLWRTLQPLPLPLRRGVASACRAATRLLAPLPWKKGPSGSLSFRFSRLAERLAMPDIDAMRLSFIGGAGYARIAPHAPCDAPQSSTPITPYVPLRRLMLGDQSDYLPDDILFKVDRAAMAHSLETRVPLLDHRVVALSWRLAAPLLATGGKGKQPLRHILEKYVPSNIFERPKQGFSPPMDTWLRGPLREWAEARLSESSLRELPMLDTKEVRAIWKAHVDSRMNAANTLWSVLMLTDWRERYKATC
jgi:asparagine synthase (glutamine-hydrolysing)